MSNSVGYKSSPVGELQRTLEEKYDINSIWKELIQNAEDAGATQLHLAWISGDSVCKNTLLHTNILLVLNDGEFDVNDEIGIQWFGSSTKSGEGQKIGRFGIGMKSIHHLCEAFFYLASPNQPACKAQQEAINNLINPWQPDDKPDAIHPLWSYMDEEISYLRRAVVAWGHRCERWLCLAIPLRTEEQLGGKTPLAINYPEVSLLFDAGLGERIAPLLTLLVNLKQIHIWCQTSSGLRKECTIDANSAASLPWNPNCRLPGQDHIISREITVDHLVTGQRQIFKAVGIERLLDDPDMAALQQKGEWPKVNRLTELGSIWEKDKGEPHCAIAFTAIKAEGVHKLVYADAVFLPLADMKETEDKVAVDGYKIQMMMHGYFFVDSGRRELKSEGLGQSGIGRNIKAEWNHLLTIKGVCPLILEALDKFCSELSMGPDQVSQLTTCIKEVIEKRKMPEKYICKKWQWIRHLRKDGSAQWKLFPKDVAFYQLPGAPKDKGFIFPLEVLPGLEQVSSSLLITMHGVPRITDKLEPEAKWSSSEGTRELENILCTVTDTVFRQPGHLDYLNKCLGLAEATAISAFISHLSGLISAYGLKNVKNVPKFEQLLEILIKTDPNYLVSLPIDDVHCFPVFEDLLKLKLDQLVVPVNLITDETRSSNAVSRVFTGGKLKLDNAAKLLDAICQLKEDEVKHVFALAIYDLTDANMPEKVMKLDRRALFIVVDQATRNEQPITLGRMKELYDGNKLYVWADQNLKNFAKAVKLDLYSIKKPDVKFQHQVIKAPGDLAITMNRGTCCTLLKAKPDLSKPGERLELITWIQTIRGWTPDEKKCFRYLLHASPNDFDSDKFLLKKEMSGQDVLSAVVGIALTSAGQSWRLVSEQLVGLLTGEQERELKVKPIDKDTTIELINEIGVITIGWGAVSDQQRVGLLKILAPGKSGDGPFWKSLPLHKALVSYSPPADRLTAIGDSTFIENTSNGFPQGVNLALSGFVTILVDPLDQSLIPFYQNNGITTVTAEAAVSEFSSQKSPDKYCCEILDCLSIYIVKEPTLQKLRDAAWLPLANTQHFACPKDFIYIPGAEQELDTLLKRPELKDAFYCVNQIEQSVRSHKQLKQVLPSRDESLKRLGSCLKTVSAYAIGKIKGLDSNGDDKIKLLVKATQDLDLLHGIALLASLISHFSWEQLNTNLVPNLNRELDKQKYIDVLNGLAERHEKVKMQGEKDDVKCVHDWYLKSYLKSEHFQLDCLKKVKLFNKKDQWKASTNLCFHDPSIDIDGEFILDKEQENILSQSGHFTARQYKPNTAPAQSSADKKQYFSELAKSCPPEYIGCLLALMGDGDPEWKYLASMYLDKHKVEEIRRLVSFDAKCSRFGNWADVMSKVKPQFMVEDKAQQIQNNIFGDPIFVRISASPTYLICRFYNPQHIGHTLYFTDLRSIKISDKKGIDLIKATADYMMAYIHNQPSTCLNHLWEIIEEGDRFEVFKVKTKVISHIPVKVRELGLNNFQRLKKLIDPIFNLDEEIAEESSILFHHPGDVNARKELERKQLDKVQLVNNLEGPIRDDPEIQDELIRAIRKKIENYQYNIESVPFELFQNADDALNQLSDMAALAHYKAPLRPELLAKLDHKSITFANWGRGINLCKLPPDFTQEQGEKLKYHNDMINILGLNYSDKSSDGPKKPLNTGKYGLGFKSVYLITNEPRVLSRGLGFKIIGSTYPVELLAEERNQMTAGIDFSEDATIFSFELRDGVDTSKITDRFNRLMPYALIFSRQIKLYGFVDTVTRSWKWEEKRLDGCSKVYLGQLQTVPADKDVTNRLIIRDSTLYGALLLHLGRNGFTWMRKDVPGLWVTAPLEETENQFNFAINGHFDLDVGRAQLARDRQRNSGEADRIGKDFGEGLVQLFDSCAGNQWQSGKERLGLDQNLCEYEFWQSLWNIMAEGMAESLNADNPSHILRHSILWSAQCGMNWLIHMKEVIPSCLEARGYRTLTNYDRITYSVSGVLDKDEHKGLLETVAHWSGFKQNINPGEAVSSCRVTVPMEKLLKKEILFKPLYLCTILEWEMAGSEDVSPEKAAELGLALTSDLFNSLGDKELKEVRKITDKLRFRNEEGQYAITSDLVAEGLDVEESRRARFAPSDRLLSKDYGSRALEFFKECRREMTTSEGTLIDWGLKSETEDQRIAFLNYLVYGERLRSPQAKGDVQLMKKATWLETEINSYLCKLSIPDQSMVRGYLMLLEIPIIPPVPPPPVLDAGKILQRVYENWGKNRDHYKEEYWKLIYPENHQPKFMMPDPDNADDHTQIYQDWLSLFLFGICHTLGRPSYGQNRNFLKLCQERGWISALASEIDSPEKDDSLRKLGWVDQLDEYFDEQQTENIPYAWWLGTLLWLYFIAKRLKEYIDAFDGINRINKLFNIMHFITPRTSPVLDRGGVSAPTLNQALGIGVFFVVGELYRSGLLYNPYGHEHCYVPTKKVRDLIRELGGPDISIDINQRWESSSKIHGFLQEHLEDPTFYGDFDMPLQLMSVNPTIKQELESV